MRLLISFLALFIHNHCIAQSEITKRLVFLGNVRDATRLNNGYLDLVKTTVGLDSNTIVVYLGNNTLSGSDTASLRKEADIIQNTGAKVIFIAGYKDWANGKEAGMKSVLRQQQFIKSLDNKNIKYYPGDACGGLKEVDLGNDAEMLIMDSQWWLHEHNKPDMESECKYRTGEEILAKIEDIPKDKFDKLILFVTHHPMKNTGVHSGTFGLKQHIFPFTDIRGLRSAYIPLPLIGSLYPITRNAIVSKQDMNSAAYEAMTDKGIRTLAGIKEALKEHPFVVFVAGQEHNLQLLHEEGTYFINSGAAGLPTRVRNNRAADYVSQSAGFTVLELTTDKKVHVKFYEIRNGVVQQSYGQQLVDYSKLPPMARDTATMPMVYADSIVAKADASLAHTSGLKRLLSGENYRKEWGAPVDMKVLHIDKEKNGLEITGIGGGHESRSLQLKDTTGKKWVFRSSAKNLEAVIPEGFQKTAASDFIHDMLSGSNPYGSLVVPRLQRELHIVHATPQVYFVPNDPLLGPFRPLFANTVGQLEERKPSLNENETINTNEMLNDMVTRSDHLSDQETYLKIRLVDFLIADFDRHGYQYSWGFVDTAGKKMYYPIPKDRDQALYNNKGFVLGIARKYGYEFMVNFPPEIRNMKNMGIVGAYMDAVFMNGLSANDWQNGLSEFQAALNDTVIRSATQALPPEIYQVRGKEIESKLISRRNSLGKKGMGYYRFISKRVTVLGGNRDETFRVAQNDSGLSVTVSRENDEGSMVPAYSRTFDPAVTKEIRLFGFNGNDHFYIDSSVKSPIKLRIVGGRGNDTFNLKGKIRNYLYDLSSEDNAVIARRRTTKMFSPQPVANEYRFREPLHNTLQLPLPKFGFNGEDGVLIGAGMTYTTYGFRKVPYGSRQKIAALIAPANKAYQVSYSGEFNHVFRRYDLLANVEHFNPGLKNFFGFGNETVKTKPDEYYRTRYDYIDADLLVRRRFLNDGTMSIAAGPAVYGYWNNPEPNKSMILEYPSQAGLDSASVYSTKLYGGGKAVYRINNLNSELLPIKGIDWYTEFTALKTPSDNAKPFCALSSSLNMYSVLAGESKLLAALHLNGGHIFSEHFEYFQALTLGGNNYLRGFRSNRFAGSSLFSASAELKLKLFDFNAYVVKGDFGIVGFNDIGRVWMKNEYSDKWHHGYGGGIYLVPFNSIMLSAVMACSEEERLFNLSLGAGLNMVFQGR